MRTAPSNKSLRRSRLSVGIDEVGRGALAGPVVLAAVARWGRISWRHPELGRIRDSKKLTPACRERWFRYLSTHPALAWRVASVSPRVIDRINIANAANRAALSAYRRVATDAPRKLAFLDGGLALPAGIPQRVLIRGDERLPLIAAASIIAKVWRDRLMVRFGAQYPAYGFPVHKGYGTRHHRRVLRALGPVRIHRQSFLTRIVDRAAMARRVSPFP